ncbi:hypothetical protein KC19_3G132600 [Ceratodon purpureus]|uniref:Secreted protein n=1 Tax=Ceratodon purpureus TaxID=3225 RepID=A0A8T0ILF0_CERPU|nr:hypothetical protein KC19_3G132600 [Ceratodon purpureus]
MLMLELYSLVMVALGQQHMKVVLRLIEQSKHFAVLATGCSCFRLTSFQFQYDASYLRSECTTAVEGYLR